MNRNELRIIANCAQNAAIDASAGGDVTIVVVTVNAEGAFEMACTGKTTLAIGAMFRGATELTLVSK